MTTPYSHIIKSMHDQTGKSLNSLLYEWNKATREIQLAELRDPNAYSKLTDELLAKQNADTGISRRDLSPLIADQFRKNVLGDDTQDVDSEGMEADQMDQFEQSMNQDMEAENDMGGDDEMSFDSMFGSDDDTFNSMFGDGGMESGDSEPTETEPSSDEFTFDDLFDDTDKSSDATDYPTDTVDSADSTEDTSSENKPDEFDFDSLFK